jgi:hypothetical protein
MSGREDIDHGGILSADSLTEFHRRKRAEAELAVLEKVQEIETDRSMRRWAAAHAVAQVIADHPVAAATVGLAGLWLVSRICSGRRR